MIVNWITSLQFNVSRAKFLFHSLPPSFIFCLHSYHPVVRSRDLKVSLDFCSHSALNPNTQPLNSIDSASSLSCCPWPCPSPQFYIERGLLTPISLPLGFFLKCILHNNAVRASLPNANIVISLLSSKPTSGLP